MRSCFDLLLHEDFPLAASSSNSSSRQCYRTTEQTIPLNIERYRKTASSVLWLQLTLVVCYLPFIVAAPLAFQEILRSLFSGFNLSRELTVTLGYFNSSLNPILYCWKIREVRQAVKEIVRQLFCSSS